MNEPEPNLITSSLSRRMTWEGYALQVEVYRLEEQATWTLEVVNEDGTSFVWDDEFASERDAYSAFTDTLAAQGIDAFLDDGNVVPFPGRPH